VIVSGKFPIPGLRQKNPMTVTLAWHEIISWALTLASTILFLVERKKNDTTKYYMVLQGILRAIHQRAGFLSTNFSRAKDSERAVVPREEFLLFVESEYVNHLGLQEHIRGSMKSLQPDKDMPFDAHGFVQPPRLEPYP
jgi:hypothetical protein